MSASVTVYLLLEKGTYPLQARDKHDDPIPLPPVLAQDEELRELCCELSDLYRSCYNGQHYAEKKALCASKQLYIAAQNVYDKAVALQDGSFTVEDTVLHPLLRLYLSSLS